MQGWLQNTINKSLQSKYSIINVLKTNMASFEPARDYRVVHASDITKSNFCPRQLALLSLFDKEKKGMWINTALRATFDVGNATADLFRENWAGEAAHGFWRCVRCGHQSAFGKKPSTYCKDGHKCVHKYVEPNFVSKEFDVSGSIDVMMDLGAPKLFVTELKIIAPDEFEKLIMPLAEHRIRTQLYLKIIDDDQDVFRERVNLEEGRVFYVSRAYGKKHIELNEVLPFKEFIVKRDDATLEPYLAKAKEIKIFKDTGTMPKGICATALDGPAKSCSVCKECFSVHPAGTIVPPELKDAA